MELNIESYLNPFISVCVEVFDKQCSIAISSGRPYIVKKDFVGEWDISGLIGFTGEARGAVVISMKKKCALGLVDKLTGSRHRDFDAEVVDVIGELINIIAGRAKHRLEEEFSLVISLPSIIEGSKHVIHWPGESPRIICIPFKVSADENFVLSVTLEKT
jgi:chemotaxis protein CheX